MGAITPGEVGELFGSLLAQHIQLAAKYDCLVDLLMYKVAIPGQPIITQADLDMVAEAAMEESARQMDKLKEEIDGAA